MQTKPGHYKVECPKCHAVLEQCRCPGPKETRHVVCDRCKSKTK